MDRRQFSSFLPMLAAASAFLDEEAHPQSAAQPVLPKAPATIQSGVYVAAKEHVAGPGRVSQAFLAGMLSPVLRLEAHETVIEPGAPPEETRKHLHHEIWLMKEGSVELWADGKSNIMHQGDLGLVTAGTMHYVKNAGMDKASYFVLAVGPPE